MGEMASTLPWFRELPADKRAWAMLVYKGAGLFTDHLISQRRASGRTVAAYRDTFKPLLGFA